MDGWMDGKEGGGEDEMKRRRIIEISSYHGHTHGAKVEEEKDNHRANVQPENHTAVLAIH